MTCTMPESDRYILISADAQAYIRFDLNAETWINFAAVQAQSVADAMLQAAVSAAISAS